MAHSNKEKGTRGALVPRRPHAIVVPGERRPALPATVKQATQAAAVSLATLAVRAGAAWIKRRVEQRRGEKRRAVARRRTGTPADTAQALVPVEPATAATAPRLRIERRRIVRVWRQGGVAEQWVDDETWTLTQEQ